MLNRQITYRIWNIYIIAEVPKFKKGSWYERQTAYV